MYKKTKKLNTNENKLYSKILSLSRNKLLYMNFDIDDTFQNRIYLIFLHISFIFIKIKKLNNNIDYKIFYQKMFDNIFKKIEINMREIGHGDTTVNKNMKFLVKVFYDILLNCEKYDKKNFNDKAIFLSKYVTRKDIKKVNNTNDIVKYFDQYHSFCLDLSIDNVLMGNLNFKYK